MMRVMLENYGNPSSMHFMGRDASAELFNARRSIADALGARTDETYFTSGGTESANWAIFGSSQALFRKGRHIITTAIEHDAVLKPVKKLEKEGWEVTYLKPDSAGRITAEGFAAELREDTVLASVMLVNNETGAVNPIREFSDEIKRRGLRTALHTDAVQGFCKIPFTVKSLGVDLLSVSSHKIHGPKGVGALFVRNSARLFPLFFGGGQETGRRAGTEALPAIAGFGVAARLGWQKLGETAAYVRQLRDHTVGRLKARLPGVVIIGEGDSPHLLSFSLPGYKSEVLMNCLENEGICVSKGSACKKGLRSRVLEAMRLSDDVIDGALRVSFSHYNTSDEADIFVETLAGALASLVV